MWIGETWDLQLRRNLNDWELEIIASFHNTMAEFNFLNMEEDRLLWQKDSTGMFSVSSAYKELNTSEAKEKYWPWKMIWKT